jgi:hypothetical protein
MVAPCGRLFLKIKRSKTLLCDELEQAKSTIIAEAKGSANLK